MWWAWASSTLSFCLAQNHHVTFSSKGCHGEPKLIIPNSFHEFDDATFVKCGPVSWEQASCCFNYTQSDDVHGPGSHRAIVLNFKSVSSLSLSLSSSFFSSLSSRWDCSAAKETSGSYSQSQRHTEVCEAGSCPVWTCTRSLPGYFEAKHRPVQQLCSAGGVKVSQFMNIFIYTWVGS